MSLNKDVKSAPAAASASKGPAPPATLPAATTTTTAGTTPVKSAPATATPATGNGTPSKGPAPPATATASPATLTKGASSAGEKDDDKSAAAAAAGGKSAAEFKRRSQLSVDIKGRASTEVFCVQYSPDSRFLACGCGDGSIRIFGAGGKLLYTLSNLTATSATANLPTTTIRFRPPTATAKSKNSVLIAGNADGTVTQWHMTAQACLYSIEEEENQVYTVDYRRDGEMFATAGRDTKIRLYEEATKTLLRTMSAGTSSGKTSKPALAGSSGSSAGAGSGHSNRIYCVKYRSTDPNVLISGGWDNTIQVWDTRVGNSVKSIYGPHICGDSLDMDANGDVLLTGSWRPDNALQLWDFGTGKLLDTLIWAPKVKGKTKEPEMVYSAQFSPANEWIAAGGSGTNEARIFEYDTSKKYKCLDRVRMAGGEKGVYTVAFSPNGRKLAVAGADKTVTVVDIK